MSALGAFEKMMQNGGKILSIADDFVEIAVPEALQKAHGLPPTMKLNPKVLEKHQEVIQKGMQKYIPGDLPEIGKVDYIPGDVPIGDVIHVKPGESLGEKLQNREIAKSNPTPATFEGMSEEDIRQAFEEGQNKGLLDKPKVAGIATGLPMVNKPTDMNPLNDLKNLFSKYTSMKDSIAKKAAEQIDLSKDPSTRENIAKALGIAADPMNIVPGVAGAGIAAADVLSSFGGKETPPTEMEQLLKQIPEPQFKKTKKLLGK